MTMQPAKLREKKLRGLDRSGEAEIKSGRKEAAAEAAVEAACATAKIGEEAAEAAVNSCKLMQRFGSGGRRGGEE